MAQKEVTSPAVNKRFDIECRVAKVDSKLGLVFGWAMITHEDGKRYFDRQGDHITQKAMLESSTEFAKSARVAGDMHSPGDVSGQVIHMMPLTDEVAGSFGITCAKRGLMIAMAPDAEMLKKFEDGTYTAFSIGGFRGEDEEVAE